MLKKIVIVIAVLAGAGLAGFLYLTRPVAEPTTDVTKSNEVPAPRPAGFSGFKIIAGASKAQFIIDEVLNGKDNTVIGSTGEIGGEILLDLKNPSNSKVGEIRINARTFKTDNERRDSAIARFILKSERPENEIIYFRASGISGMPTEIKIGEEFGFKISGELWISGVAREVSFDAKAKLISEKELTGSTETTILYKDFGISIPQVPSVASVEDQVILKAQVTGRAQ